MEKNLTLLGQYNFELVTKPPQWCDTSSIAIWQWELRGNGKSLKRSKIKVRISGRTDNWKAVIDKAHEICDQLNSGTYKGPITVRVSSKKTN